MPCSIIGASSASVTLSRVTLRRRYVEFGNNCCMQALVELPWTLAKRGVNKTRRLLTIRQLKKCRDGCNALGFVFSLVESSQYAFVFLSLPSILLKIKIIENSSCNIYLSTIVREHIGRDFYDVIYFSTVEATVKSKYDAHSAYPTCESHYPDQKRPQKITRCLCYRMQQQQQK